jgi:hypothetical protein
MELDTPAAAHEPQKKEEETHQEIPPRNIEETVGANRSTQNPKAEVQPDVPQIPIPYFFLAKPTSEMATAWVEWMVKEQLEATGTSSQPLQ